MSIKTDSTDIMTIMILSILAIIAWVLISGAVWWVFLWSFNFPIAFAWKQIIGVALITGTFAPKSFKSSKTSKSKGK